MDFRCPDRRKSLENRLCVSRSRLLPGGFSGPGLSFPGPPVAECNFWPAATFIPRTMSKRFQQWVAEYQDQAWSLARYLLKDAAEAEDVCQESFVKLWHQQDSIDPDKARAWLMKVTRNGCLDRLRRRKPSEELGEWHVDGVSAGPQQGAEHRELGAWLQKSIDQLGEPYRSLVVLRDVQQNSYEEVADALELSLSQVKVYLHRARKQLREELAEVRP